MPRVTIGLPVYNGENYLAEAVRSLLDQSFRDFELIIADNASTDATEEICRGFAAGDPRVVYVRHAENLGAAANFNDVFARATGDYFKWQAHDDVCGPEYLERCVRVLDEDPSVVLAHTRSARLDEDGNVVGTYEYPVRYDDPRASHRFRDLTVVRHHCINVFGVIRPEVLARTPLIGTYVASDRVLLAELALHGRLVELPEVQFYRRFHPRASSALDERSDRLAWFDPNLSGTVSYPNWRVLQEYVKAVGRAPLNPFQRLDCLLRLGAHVRLRRPYLRWDLVQAQKMLLNRSAIGRKLLAGYRRARGDDDAHQAG